MDNILKRYIYLMGCLLLLSSFTFVSPPSQQPTQLAIMRRVNVPYFGGAVRFSETAIFWFGRVTPTENSVDVRIGYNDDHLLVHVAVIDRLAWYDTSPTAETLDQWDGATLYMDTRQLAEDEISETSYRFDAQLVWWEEDRSSYQAVYRGDDAGWTLVEIPFTTRSNWRGDEPNNHVDDRGWLVQYEIPFESLGLNGPPSQGTRWSFSVVAHDRDGDDIPPEPDQTWPEDASTLQPATWGDLVFGLPMSEIPLASSEATVTVREGLGDIVVQDAPVGGGTLCGGNADYWTEWGALSYGDTDVANVQNQQDISDWPCFSRYYLTFPLNALPPDRVVISATLTLYHMGNTGVGWDPGPQPSLVQVLTVDEPWDEATISWNNAPQARENITGTWVEPIEAYPDPPGIPYDWNVTDAVAESHAAGEPLRLAVYEADAKIQSGKYFHTSEEDAFNAMGRPTLRVTYGIAPNLEMQASSTIGTQGDVIWYTLSFRGLDRPLVLTNTLPSGLGQPTSVTVSGSEFVPVYDSDKQQLRWEGAPDQGEPVEIRYAASVITDQLRELINETILIGADGFTKKTEVADVVVVANPHLIHLPLVLRY